MKKPVRVPVAALLLVVALNPLGAQTLPRGEWSGTLSWCCARPGSPGVAPVQHRFDAIYYVTVQGETVAASGRFTSPHTGDGLALTLNDMKVIGDTLTFWVSDDELSTDERAVCTLRRRDDGAFEGPCSVATTDNLRMLMVPPERR